MKDDQKEGQQARGAAILAMAALFHAAHIVRGQNPLAETSIAEAEKMVKEAEAKKLVDFSA